MAHVYWRLRTLAGTYGCVNEWVPYDGTGTAIATTGGTASADNSAFGAAANAFDGNASTLWCPSGPNTFPHWLQYQFPSAVEIASFTILSNNGGAGDAIIDLDLQYSDDGSTWFTKYSYRGVCWSSIGPITFNAANALPALGIAWRLLVNSTYASSLLEIAEIVLRDGGGSAIATTQYAATAYNTYNGDATHGAFAALNGDGLTTFWSSASNTTPGWIAYRFGSLTQVASFCITSPASDGPSSVTLQYSYDETNWTSVGTFTPTNSSSQQCFSLGGTFPAAASITDSPSVGTQGASYTITITGTGTHFAAGVTTVSFSGSGGTVSAVSVASATILTFTLALSATAAVGAQTITVTTGAEAPTATFTVGAGGRGNIDYDQIGLDARHGSTGTKIQYSDNTGATNHLAAFDAAGNVTDSGISTAGVGGGTVTSVALTVPSDKSVSGSPITSAGTFAITDNTQTANKVKAGPSSGGAATPGYRALVAADLPLATTGAFGAVKPDGTTITILSGVISSSGGGGGYNAGTVPAVIQVAYVVSGGNSATFGAAPTNGNLLVAMSFNPTSNATGTGWTKQVEQANGTDWGDIWTKVAGAGESTTQSPISGVSTTGAIVIWELNGQNATSPFVYGLSQVEQSGNPSTPIYFPNLKNCIGLAAIAVISTPTIISAFNLGVQDVLDNTNTRRLAAGHTDLSITPQVGAWAFFSATASSKAATCLITS